MKTVIASSAPNVLVDCLSFAMQHMVEKGSVTHQQSISAERMRSVILHPTSDIQIHASLQVVENADQADLHPSLNAQYTIANSVGVSSEIAREVVFCRSATLDGESRKMITHEAGGAISHSAMVVALNKMALKVMGRNTGSAITDKAKAIGWYLDFLAIRVNERLMDMPEHGVTSLLECVITMRRMMDSSISTSISIAARHGNRILRYVVQDQTGMIEGERMLVEDPVLEHGILKLGSNAIGLFLGKNRMEALDGFCKDGKTTIVEHIHANIDESGRFSDLPQELRDLNTVTYVFAEEAFRQIAKQARLNRQPPEGGWLPKNLDEILGRVLFAKKGCVSAEREKWILSNLTAFITSVVQTYSALLYAGYGANYRKREEETRLSIANDLQSL